MLPYLLLTAVLATRTERATSTLAPTITTRASSDQVDRERYMLPERVAKISASPSPHMSPEPNLVATVMAKTHLFFKVVSSNLEQALERFAAFFTAPTFATRASSDKVDRERNMSPERPASIASTALTTTLTATLTTSSVNAAFSASVSATLTATLSATLATTTATAAANATMAIPAAVSIAVSAAIPTSPFSIAAAPPPAPPGGFPVPVISAPFTFAGDSSNSGDEFYRFQMHFPGSLLAMDGRSDAKCPESECCVAMAIAWATGKRLASNFVERTGGIYETNNSIPAQSRFRDDLNVCNWRLGDFMCFKACLYDDGGVAGPEYYLTDCALGTDCTDCGPRTYASASVGTELTCNLNDGPKSLDCIWAADSPLDRERFLAAAPMAGGLTACIIECGPLRGNHGSCSNSASCPYLSTAVGGTGLYCNPDGKATIDPRAIFHHATSTERNSTTADGLCKGARIVFEIALEELFIKGKIGDADGKDSFPYDQTNANEDTKYEPAENSADSDGVPWNRVECFDLAFVLLRLASFVWVICASSRRRSGPNERFANQMQRNQHFALALLVLLVPRPPPLPCTALPCTEASDIPGLYSVQLVPSHRRELQTAVSTSAGLLSALANTGVGHIVFVPGTYTLKCRLSGYSIAPGARAEPLPPACSRSSETGCQCLRKPQVRPTPPILCMHTCVYALDNYCDSPCSELPMCAYGADCVDCAPCMPRSPPQLPVSGPPRPFDASDGCCNDGGSGAEYPDCQCDTDCADCADCADCGMRQPLQLPTAGSPPGEDICLETCFCADGDDGGSSSEFP
eukprot:jgi/Chrpa1/15690/Chrysochromulina_OHIO_Genome00022209-RA